MTKNATKERGIGECMKKIRGKGMEEKCHLSQRRPILPVVIVIHAAPTFCVPFRSRVFKSEKTKRQTLTNATEPVS